MAWLKFLQLSIAKKFGALYALLFALIAGIGVVVILQMRVMQRDAQILLEETREHVIARDILTLIESLRTKSGEVRPRQPIQDPRAEALELLTRIAVKFAELAQSHDDPSREEHQHKEDLILESIQDDLARFDGQLRTAEMISDAPFETLDHVQDFISSLIAETRHEYQLADAGLERAGTETSRVMALTVAAALVLLATSLVLVFRGVIAPVRRLRLGAQQLGRGDLAHRIAISNTDELGSLARSFNDMASQVSQTHAELEARVAARTKQFLRAARLADIGMLTAGVAHEINNPLASISACAEGLLRRLDGNHLESSELAEYLTIIQTESGRAKAITSRLLALARQDQGEVSEFQLGLALDHVQKAVVHIFEKSGIELVVSVDSPDVAVIGNAGELTQICMNLLGNAKDASPRGSTVRLQCSVRGDRLLVEVTDEGCGIPPADLDRVFEPFFTTKTAGQGTGLGLALVEAIVQARGGHIEVLSGIGEGSRFLVDLPLEWSRS